jgi:hypothetical protein
VVKKTVRSKYQRLATSRPVEISDPELMFGLVGPIGVNIDAVIDALRSALEDVEYDSQLIHLTSALDPVPLKTKVDNSSYFSRYMSLIKRANEYRKAAGNAAAMAGLAILHIRKRRNDLGAPASEPALGNAFIVRQFKRPEEIELLRRTYGRKFIQISVYGSESDRRTVLIEKIRKFDQSPKKDAD